MRHPLISIAVAAALGCATTAHAMTCNIVLDRNDVIIYRDVVPPVDLSERGNEARAAMRKRGEFLLMMEADQCPTFVATSNVPGAAGASVDEIVAGLRPYTGGGGAGSSGRRGAAAAPAIPAVTSSARPTY